MDNIDNVRIFDMDFATEMKKSFIAYAMAVIKGRALPDVRDGLKPVHRRILYSMDELSMQPDKPFRKSARLVGDAMGKYHPHGDSSIYDAMVRLAQPFNIRYPLVLGQGNFGSVDGDSAAAMRYTEAKMSKLTMEMLRDIDKNTVDFYPNFDETLMQPTVLPSRFPNLLVNGTGGIAVGMASNIPPHNLGEVINAYTAMLDNPDISVDELMAYIKGPDFPTGGIILGTSGIKQAYRTGRGKIIIRARTEIEEMSNGKCRIIVTEIPYQVNKARLVERIAELVHAKTIEGITDLRDESDRNGMRIVIELRRDVNANVMLNNLYKHTALQDTFGVIMLAIVNNEPKILNLRELLYNYMLFQEEVVTRRTKYNLERALERLHILEGLIIALDNIDEIVEMIKASPSAPVAKERLTERFALSDKQAQAILDMRLQRLTGLERDKIVNEHKELTETVEYLRRILSDDGLLRSILKEEALDISNRFSDARKTELAPMADDIDLDDVIQEEDMIVTMSRLGYVKRTSTDTYRSQNRGGKGIMGQTTREEDFVERMFSSSTHTNIMFFTNMGRAFKLKCYMIPEAGRTAKGMAIVNLLQLAPEEKVAFAFPVEKEEGYLVFATKLGVIKKTPLDEFANIRKTGLIALNIRENDALIGVTHSTGEDEFLVGTRNGMCIRFHEDDVRSMGRTAAGVRSIALEGDDEVVNVEKIIPGGYVLSITECGIGKRTNESEYRVQRRGGKGLISNQLTQATGRLCCLKLCNGDEDMMLIRDDGTIIRTPVEQVSVTGRNTRGVRIMRISDDSKVMCVELVPHEDEKDDTAEVTTVETDTKE